MLCKPMVIRPDVVELTSTRDCRFQSREAEGKVLVYITTLVSRFNMALSTPSRQLSLPGKHNRDVCRFPLVTAVTRLPPWLLT